MKQDLAVLSKEEQDLLAKHHSNLIGISQLSASAEETFKRVVLEETAIGYDVASMIIGVMSTAAAVTTFCSGDVESSATILTVGSVLLANGALGLRIGSRRYRWAVWTMEHFSPKRWSKKKRLFNMENLEHFVKRQEALAKQFETFSDAQKEIGPIIEKLNRNPVEGQWIYELTKNGVELYIPRKVDQMKMLSG